MKVIATIQADLDETTLGTRSRLADELGGVSILRRTVQRAVEAKRIEEVYVLCPVEQHARCAAMLEGVGAIVRKFDAPPAPWASLVQTARKWSLESWRGGVGGTTCFDEYTDACLINGLIAELDVDAVLSVPPAAPLFDPVLADRMIEHYCENEDVTRLTFTQAPPGIAGILLEAALVTELAEKGIPIGWTFSYKPDTPAKDLVFQPSCCEIPAGLRYAVGRLSADTDRATQRVKALISEHDNPDPATIGAWLAEHEATTVEPMPREVEIELTTDDPHPHALLTPRGDRVDSRGPVDPAVVERVVQNICRYDDALLVLGGFGDPLRHPQFRRVLEVIRSVRHNGHGLYGLAIRTAAVDLSDDHIDAIISHGVDILDVTLDAWTPQLYGELQAPNDPQSADLDAVVRNLDRLAEIRQQRRTVKPAVVPEMAKARENVHELDDFHDGWLRRVGAVAITGYSHHAAQCEDRRVINMAPSPRIACRRLRSRCVVLADGRVTACDQDFNGLHTAGWIGEQSLEELWTGASFSRLRSAHRRDNLDATPLCTGCDEWHRP